MVDSPSGERIAELEAEVQRLRHLVGPSESDYETLRKEVWRLRDEVLGLQGQAGTARGAVAGAPHRSFGKVEICHDALDLQVAELLGEGAGREQ